MEPIETLTILKDKDSDNDASFDSNNSKTSSNIEIPKENDDTSSESSKGPIHIDPNYEWLLKDLSLDDDRRVIDVTDLLNDQTDQNDIKKVEQETEETEETGTIEESKLSIQNDSHSHNEDETCITELYSKISKMTSDDDEKVNNGATCCLESEKVF
jgi:hypothetical protein